MISAYTGTQVRNAEARFLQAGLDSRTGAALMQQAAYGLANAVVRELLGRGQRRYGASVTVLAGKGNNGGDGLFAAALLAGRGMSTTAVLTSEEAHPAGLAAFEKAGGRALRLTVENVAEMSVAVRRSDVVIDAVLGTGAQGGLRGPTAELVKELQRSRPRLVIACDIPSGVQADTGEAQPPVLAADLTVTFGAVKTGLFTDPGADYSGDVRLVRIGIDGELPDPDLRRLEAEDLARLLPRPERRSHKYSRGVLGVIAGSDQYPGAAVLACQGALAAGVGMVRYLGPPGVADLVRQACPEVVCTTADPANTHVQAWLLGSGLDEGASEQLERVRAAAATGLPTVADAGALPALPRELTEQTILTPHAGELTALLTRYGADAARGRVEDAPLAAARHAARLTGATVLLKGATTIVAAPAGGAFSQAEATPWMATAGSGDVLAGMLGALLAQLAGHGDSFALQGIPSEDRWAGIAAMAASLHGRAGQRASGGGPVTASAIAQALTEVLREL